MKKNFTKKTKQQLAKPFVKKSANDIKNARTTKFSKHFIKEDDKTHQLKVAAYPQIVSEIYGVDVNNATDLIKNGDVSVNRAIQTDPSFVLNVGDYVIVAEGHYVKNTGYSAKIIA